MNNNKITVVMPTFNRENLIEKSIQSILLQTYKNFELYILDDGSTDNTKDIVQKYLSDPRVKYMYHKNQGEAETVNWGWSLAEGEYFTQVNSDDTITPDSFEIMVKYMDKNPEKIVGYPDFNFIDENDNIISTTKSPKWNFLQALKDFSCYAASAGTFIRKSKLRQLKKLKRSEFKYINDIEMYWDIALVGDFIHVPYVLANWRVHPGQISNSRYKSIPEIEKWFNNYFSKKELPPKVYEIKDKVRKTILKYYIDLIDKSELATKDKKELQKTYLTELGIPCYDFSVLEISDNDLIGNKFNGHNLHNYLRTKNIDAKQLVQNKLSDDIYTYQTDSFKNLLNNKLIYEADIIHLHLIHNTDLDIQILPILCRLKPVIITLHDRFFASGHCVYPCGCEKWKTFCADCPKLDIPFKMKKDYTALNFFIKKEAIQKSDISAIVASDFMMNVYQESPIWSQKKIYKLPFGIDQHIFKPIDKAQAKQKLGINQDAIVIMFRSTKNEFKGLDIILDALENLKTTAPITLITTDEQGLLKKLKNKYNIKEFGWVHQDEKMAELYQAADLFLMPSSQEAFGLMAVEAMSCQTPVLTIYGTSLESIIDGNDCGFCVQKDDFSAELQKIVNDKSILRQKGQKALEFAKKNYNLETYLAGMINIYKEVIQNHPSTSEANIVVSQMQKLSDNGSDKKTIVNYGNLFSITKEDNRTTIKFMGIKFKYGKKK